MLVLQLLGSALQPIAPQGSRLDYVVLPQEWQSFEVSSMTVPDIDPGHSNIDHIALSTRIVFPMPLSKRVKKRGQLRAPIDWTAVRKCRDAETWRQLFAKLPQPEWSCDVHTHWQLIHDALLDQIAALFPRPPSKPRMPYIDDDTWQLRNRKQALRRQFALRAHVCPRLPLLAPFQALRLGTSLRASYIKIIVWVLRCAHRQRHDQVLLRELHHELRGRLRDARTAYIAEVADSANAATGEQIYAQLRKIGFRSKRRQFDRPLPQLRGPEGTMIKHADELRQTWRTYFAQIECGHQVRHDELLQLCVCTEMENKFRPSEDYLRALPSLHALERALRRCRPHRASGPDAIPPELCHFASKWMGHMLAPLVMKCSMYAAEPIHWKGGVLHEVWKRKGATTDPSSYRGILVSSHLATCFHNIFRGPTLGWRLKSADALQYGGSTW